MKRNICPDCGRPIKCHSCITSRGGKAGTGAAKARPSAMMRAAALKRWKKVKKLSAYKTREIPSKTAVFRAHDAQRKGTCG